MSSAQLVPATAAEARDLTDQIKVAVDGTWHLIKRAYLTRAWDALGYDSWDDYCTREFGTSRLRLPREERQEVVSSMREIGMSTRAIAAATGHAKQTITNELRQLSQSRTPEPINVHELREYYDNHDTSAEMDGGYFEEDEPVEKVRAAFDQGEKGVTAPPPRVTGTDGKSYSGQSSRPPNRPALPPQFASASGELSRVIGRLEKLRADDRYRSNRLAIADQCVPQIRRAIEVLSDLMDDLEQDEGGPT